MVRVKMVGALHIPNPIRANFVQVVPGDEGCFPLVFWADLNLVTVEGVYNVYYGAGVSDS